MSKQVKTPRFYCDVPTYLHAVGYTDFFRNDGRWSTDLLYMNPASPTLYQPTTGNIQNGEFSSHRIGRDLYGRTAYDINFIALLNHNFAHETGLAHGNGNEVQITLKKSMWEDPAEGTQVPYFKNILNAHPSSHFNGIVLQPEWNGTSIVGVYSDTAKTKPMNHLWCRFSTWWHERTPDTDEMSPGWEVTPMALGSFVVGKYWDAPYGPDLKLTMSRRFPGTKKQTSVGGKTFVNRYYDGPVDWTMYGWLGHDSGVRDVRQYSPFELDFPEGSSTDTHPDGYEYEMGSEYNLHRSKPGLGKKGMRSWKLTFSYMSEDDMWIGYDSSSIAPFELNASDSNADTDSTIPSDDGVDVNVGSDHRTKTNPILADDSFNYVWNVTLGGALPFMFQPDNTNKNPDQFAICTFKENSLKVTQVAHNTYSISVTIDELG